MIKRIQVAARKTNQTAVETNAITQAIAVQASTPYSVEVGVGLLKNLPSVSNQAFVVCQPGSRIHAQTVVGVLEKQKTNVTLFELPDKEAAKTIDTYQRLLQAGLDAGIERNATVYAVGGGCVGDAAGFFAATYMRGLSVVHVPTTLLAMVDSSIGGKTAINVGQTKNIAGAFWQPRAMVCDVKTLDTLPEDQMRNGLAEVIKHGLILDAGYFDFVNENLQGILDKDPAVLVKTVAQSVRIKAAVVQRDERETSDRMKLNYGHTAGHAIEAVTTLPHGSAISVGMVAEGHLSCALGFLSPVDLEKQNALLKKAGLPLAATFEIDAVLEKMRHDKKRIDQTHRVVALDRIGACHVQTVAESKIERALEKVRTG